MDNSFLQQSPTSKTDWRITPFSATLSPKPSLLELRLPRTNKKELSTQPCQEDTERFAKFITVLKDQGFTDQQIQSKVGGGASFIDPSLKAPGFKL